MAFFDVKKFLKEYRIQSWPEGSKNVPSGHVGVRCPFCGDRSNHLHFLLEGWKAKCWRCGKKKIPDVIAALLRLPAPEAEKIFYKFINRSGAPGRVEYVFERTRGSDLVVMPGGTGQMADDHRDYLSSRRFDPYELEATWGLLGTDHRDPDYRWRIVAPVTFQGNLVSYQARTIVKDVTPPYRACPPEGEVISHKNLLYGFDQARFRRVVVAEGVTDVWRLGPGAVGTFGASFSPAQANLLITCFDEVFILYDPDAAGREGGKALFNAIRPLKEKVYVMELEQAEDPGSLPASEAKYIMEKVFKIR